MSEKTKLTLWGEIKKVDTFHGVDEYIVLSLDGGAIVEEILVNEYTNLQLYKLIRG